MTNGMNPEDYFDGADTQTAAAQEPVTLQRFMDLAEQARDLEKQIEVDSLALKNKNDRLMTILRDLIPSMMTELGLQDFTLKDGSKIKIKLVLHASITEANKPAAFAWLESNNFDAIIKTNVKADFGKGEMDEAKRAVEALLQAGFDASLDRNVHASTLKSFIVEQLEAGTAIPMDIFSIHQFEEAQISRPRERRSRG